MKKDPNRFWLLVILLGWLFDFLFWEMPSLGINFVIYVLLCLGTGIYLLRSDGLRLAPRSSLLLIPITFFAAQSVLRQEPMTVFLSVIMTLFLMGIFAITYISGQWMKLSLVDYMLGYLSLAGSMIARPLGFSAGVKDQAAAGEKRSGQFWPVIRGLVIAIPVIAVFASLLSSADPIFAERFKELIDIFNIENLPEYIFRLFYILVFAYALAGTFLHAAQRSHEEVGDRQLVAPFLGFTESSIVLGSVTLLFAAFVIIQVQYFFGGQANITVDGYTYSDYARRGFGELVTVAFFSLLLLLGLGAITRRENDLQRRWFSGLGVGLVGLVIVMLVSAFQRLVLYEMAYGFSRLRAYTHVFMIWLGMLLVVVVLLEVSRRERQVGLAMLLASVGFVTSLSLLNVDGFIVRQNVQRELTQPGQNVIVNGHRELDAQYFLNLSDDAIPALVAAFENKSLPAEVHEKLGVALVCKQDNNDRFAQEIPWQAFNLSRERAQNAYLQVQTELDGYRVSNSSSVTTVTTPTGGEFSCWQYYYD